MTKSLFLTLVVLSAAPAAWAASGLIIVQTSEVLTDGTTSRQTIYMERERMVAESDAAGEPTAFAYLASEGLMRIINHRDKSYHEMTEADLDRFAGQAEAASAQMRQAMEQLKNLPPEQRAMAEKMMKDRMPGMAAGPATEEPLEYRRGQGSGEVGGRACAWHDGYRGRRLVSRVCVAEWSAFDVSEADFAVLKRMSELVQRLAPGQTNRLSGAPSNWADFGKINGLPVEFEEISDGRATLRVRMGEIRRGDVPEEKYLPVGYQRRSMPGAR